MVKLPRIFINYIYNSLHVYKLVATQSAIAVSQCIRYQCDNATSNFQLRHFIPECFATFAYFFIDFVSRLTFIVRTLNLELI